MKHIQDLIVRRRADLALTYEQLAVRSGGKVSRTLLNQLATGRHNSRLSDRSIEGIAEALDVSEDEVREAVDEPSRPEFSLGPRAKLLTDPQRRAMIAVMEAFLAGENGAADGEALVTERNRATTQDSHQASRV